MIVQAADAHAQIQRLVSVVKIETVLQEYPTEEQNSIVRCLWAKGLNAKDIHKEMLSVYGGKCCRGKRLTTGSRHFSRTFKSRGDEAEVRKWLRQQSKDFHAAYFDALVKRWDKCMNVGGGYVEK
jgi:hypothetical protein